MFVFRCADCGCRAAPWEEVYSWDTRDGRVYLCEDCFDARFGELTRRERAALIGSDVLRAEELGGAET